MTTRIASYNTHKCVGVDGQRDPGRVLDVINALGADVVALQEVDHRLGQRPAALPARMIEADTDYDIAELPRTGPDSLGWHGQAVLIRRGSRITATHGIALPGLEPRGALTATISVAGRPTFTLFAAHLGLRRMDRRAQWERLAQQMAEARAPALAIGDFNEWSKGRGFEPLAGFEVLAPGRSYPSRLPFGRLDRIVAGPGLTVERMGVFDSPLARKASDHLPIWADVRADVAPPSPPFTSPPADD